MLFKQSSRWLLLLAPVILSACEKVIDVDLNETEPQLVVEASHYSGSGLFEARITQTNSYFANETPPTVTDATVMIADNTGATYLLEHQSNGYYSLALDVPADASYMMHVDWNGSQYEASAYLPERVPITHLRVEEREEDGIRGGGNNTEGAFRIFVGFDDPAEDENYYRIDYDVIGKADEQRGIQVLNGTSSNGTSIEIPVRVGRVNLESGDSISVRLISIDRSTYQYYLVLSDLITNGNDNNPNSGSAAPGNPVNNWSGDILGHFYTLNADTMGIKIP